MNGENEHLDFLISQYVDGSLEGAGKKSVEQKLLTDPEARKLYAAHREVQDILDDFGSRIPLINWEEFDQKLADRLEAEAREKQRGSIFRRRMRPVAAAAALLMAAGLGYAWHALSNHTVRQAPGDLAVRQVVAPPSPSVVPPEGIAANDADRGVAKVEEPGGSDAAGGAGEGIASGASADQVAYQALAMSVQYGLGNLPRGAVPETTPARGTGVNSPGPARPMDDRGMLQ
jgi:anti-sigma factor RsiW